MAAAPKRRWRRFSLRTMFVAFTVVAVWLGWNLSLVEQRRQMREAVRKFHSYNPFRSAMLAGEDVFPGVNDAERDAVMNEIARSVRNPKQHKSVEENFWRYPPSAPYSLPIVRRLLGDKLVTSLTYRPGPDVDEVRRLFAEAVIFVEKPGAVIEE